MDLHEYQGKIILRKFGVAVPEGIVAETPAEAVEAAKKLQETTGTQSWAIKAQVHAGGRGKAGGVKIAKNLEEVETSAKQIIGMTLVTKQTGTAGKLVRKLLVEQSIYYPNAEGKVDVAEYYMSILLNRATGRNIIMYSPKGGMNIEEVAEQTPESGNRHPSFPSCPHSVQPWSQRQRFQKHEEIRHRTLQRIH